MQHEARVPMGLTVGDLLASRARVRQEPRLSTPMEVLREIQRRDPDGDETRTGTPTLDEVNAFEAWIEETYGGQAVTDYYRIWGPRPEV